VTNDSADNCTADGSYGTATSQYRTTDGTNAGTDGGVLVLRGHAGTSAKT
jgi:hypothetical protein